MLTNQSTSPSKACLYIYYTYLIRFSNRHGALYNIIIYLLQEHPCKLGVSVEYSANLLAACKDRDTSHKFKFNY